VALLRRFRRRLVLVAFVRTLPLAAVVATTAALAVARGAHLQPAAVATTLLIGLFIASLATASIAWRQTGRLGQTATTLDRRFGLANRVATALEFAGHDDDVSRLILADAERTLRRHESNELSFEAPTHLAWLLTVVAAAGVLFVWTSPASSDTGEAVASQGVLGAVSTASPSSEKRSPTSMTANSAVIHTIEGAPRPQASDSTTHSEPAATRPAEARRDPTGARGENSEFSTDRGQSRNAGDVSRNSVWGARAERGGSSASTELRTTVDGTGGVRGSSPQDGSASDKRQQAGDTSVTSTPLAAWDRAETALARDHLPVELRSYVRDYLIAIRPGNQP